MKQNLSLALASSLVLVVGSSAITACETATTPGTTAEFDGGSSTFDATAPVFDAGADTDAATPDAGDAGDAGIDASVDAGLNDTPLVGVAGGGRSDDTCPAGQVVIGVEGGVVTSGFYAGVVSKFRTICGTLVAPAGGDTEVTIAAGDTVPADAADARGITAAPVTQVVCPANQVVVSIQGRTTPKNYPPVINDPASLEIFCAPLSWSGGALSIGTPASAGSVGTTGAPLSGPFGCATGTLARGAVVYSGQITDGVGLHCEAVTLP